MMKVLRTSLLGLGFLVACGGSASRDRHGSQPPSTTGSAGNGSRDHEADSGAGGTVPAGAATSGGRRGGTSGASAFGGGNPDEPGGMDGAGAAATLPLPPGCEPRARTETADACSLAVYCDTASQMTNCHRLYSGRWQCQCETYNRDRIYQLENAPGLQACALTAGFCAESEPELELGEESCEPTRDNSAEGGCTIDLTCAKPIELDVATEARAWLMRFGSASCSAAESGKSFECDCSYGALESSYDLLVDSGWPACRPLVDFCMSGATPTFEGEQECWPTTTASSSEGCKRSELCSARTPLTADVSLAKGEPRYANCSPREGGGADCYCWFHDSTFDFQLPGAADAASCEASILNCDEDAVIEATGASSCQPDSVTVNSDSCEADLSCVQNATVDAREIVAEGRLLVACARVEPGKPWWCSCASDQQTAQFQLGAAGVNAEQACGQAPAGCLERLAVHLGPYGDLVWPPDPLP